MNKKDVAIIIVVVLIVLFIVTFFVQSLCCAPLQPSDQTEEAALKIKSLLAKLGVAEKTGIVIFEPREILSAGAIAVRTETLSEKDVCVLIGKTENANQDRIIRKSGKIIDYTGEEKIQKKLYILCDYSQQLQGSIGEYAHNQEVIDAFANSSTCDFGTGSEERKVCIVSIIPAT